MEHDETEKYIEKTCTGLSTKQVTMLAEYSKLLFDSSKKFNLTGLKTLNDILESLVIGSIKPFNFNNVPRGTFADIGTGSGIPGIPFAICCPGMSGKLIDSNAKKIEFIKSIIDLLKLENVAAVNSRLELFGNDSDEREKYSLVLSRALGNIYTVSELGSPLLETGGLLCIYSKRTVKEVSSDILLHCSELALEPAEEATSVFNGGIVFRKTGRLNVKYPRNYPSINRAASRVNEFLS